MSLSLLGFELLVFVGALAAAEALLQIIAGNPRTRRREVVARLRRHATRIQDPEGDLSESILREARGSAGSFFAFAAQRRSLELMLYRAGMPFTVGRLAGWSAGLALGAFAIAFFIDRPLEGVAAGALAALAPLGLVLLRARARMRRFEEQLPEALDLLCRALRAGISLDFGFKSAGEELPDPIGTEFGQVAHEVSLGLPLRLALAHLGERVRARDLPFFTTAVLIQRETGGNLAEILQGLSSVVRLRLQFQLKVRALLAQVKLTANLLAVLPLIFCGLISAASPGYLDPLLHTPEGRPFLILGGVLIAVGWLTCRRLAVVRL